MSILIIYLQAGSQADGARFYSGVSRERTKGNEHRLEHRKFHTNTRKNFFTVRVTEHWNRLPREVVESPTEIFRIHLDTDLCDLL